MMMMRRFSLALAAVLAMALAACERGAEDTAQSAEHSKATFKVALLTPGPVSDAGWNALAYEGLVAIRDQLKAEIAQIETETPAEFEEGFRDFARRGYRLIFGHGFEFQDAAAAVAADFPETVFITSSGNTVRKNVAPLRFMIEEATFLQGILAGQMSKTEKAGVVGGIEIPSVKSTVLAFTAGFRLVRPHGTVLVTYVGNWEDVGAAKEAALAQVQQGADFLFHNADAAGLGVFQAAEEKKVYALGTNKDQNNVAPEVVVASAVIDIPRAFLKVAREVQEGKFEGKIERYGMKDEVISLIYNPRLESKIPERTKMFIDDARNAILRGELNVPSVEF
jgi:basic membrane lipoprotein Med (substrate-binding protein (PBP1-ABC) superfamily)